MNIYTINMLMNVSVFFDVMDSINLVILVLVLILYMTQNISAIVGLVTKPKKYPEAKVNHKYAVLISARNEEKVIGNLIDSIKKQDYPSDLVDVFVVADNCTDSTFAVARDAGAIAYERFNTEQKGKSYALDYLLSKINEDYPDKGYEAYFIFDADNLLDKNYIKEMNKAYDSGVKICTSFRDSKNFGDSWVSANSSMMFYMECCMTHQTKTRSNIGTYVSGTGYYVDAEIIKENGGWIHHLIIEDIEFTVDCALKGHKAMYCADAVFYDEQPVKLKDSYTQRLRWCKGGHQCFGKYIGSLIKKIFTGKNKTTCLGLAIHVCPAPVVGFFWILLYALTSFVEGLVVDRSVLVGFENLFTKGLLILYVFAICFIFYTIVVYVKNNHRMNVGVGKKILYGITYPVYMGIFLLTSVVALFTKVTWKAIPHVSNKKIDEVNR